MIKKILKFVLPYRIIHLIHHKKRLHNLEKLDNLFIGENVKITDDCLFEKGVKIYNNVSLDNVSVGKYTYFAPDSKFHMVSIGKYCSIGPNVKAGIGMHPTKDTVSTHPSFFSINKQSNIIFATKNCFKEFSKINIGHDVWIGMNAIIKDGVSIGDGAIIGAGAIVTKDVSSYAIMGGAPARLIRYRFNDKEIEFLKEFKWWNKPDKWLKINWENFLDIKKFIKTNNI